MKSTSAPGNHWHHHHSYSSSSLREEETGILSQTPTSSSRPLSQPNYFTKALPQLPLASSQRHKTQARNDIAVNLGLNNFRDSTNPLPEDYSTQPETTRVKGSRRPMKSQLSRTPPISTLTTSSKAILQMTEYDPRFETGRLEEHQQPRTPETPSSSDSIKLNSEQSSGSHYSQPEAREIDANELAGHSWGPLSPEDVSSQLSPVPPISPLDPVTSSHPTELGPSPPPSAQKPTGYVIPDCTSLDSKERASEIGFSSKLHFEGEHLEVRLERLALRLQQNSGETSNLRRVLISDSKEHEERPQQTARVQDQQEWSQSLAKSGELFPKPLELRPKHKPKDLTTETRSHPKTKLFTQQNVRDSSRLGANTLTSSVDYGNSLRKCNTPPSRSSSHRNLTPPISAVGTIKSDFLMPSYMPPPPIPEKSTKRENFDTNQHLLSPVPASTHKNPETPASPTDRLFRKRFSEAINHLSGLFSPPAKKDYIPSSSRGSNRSDTPAPNQTGFQALWLTKKALHRGNEHLHEMIAKAKTTIRSKSVKEKRRESLKKKIVVVGITEQSPDGRVSSWV